MAVRNRAAERGRAASAKPALGFDSVKVFSATMVHHRQQLGDRVTEWLAERPEIEIADVVITQSSDSRFHCLCISLFLRTPSLSWRAPKYPDEQRAVTEIARLKTPDDFRCHATAKKRRS